jgi:hypothetical protein
MSKEEPKLDSESTWTTNMKVFNAAKHESHVRLETAGLNAVIYIHERSMHYAHKWDYSTLISLRNVLNKWFQDQLMEP